MKKRFLTLLAVIVFVLGLGTTFVILNIEQAISSLDDLVGRYEKDRKCVRVLMAIKKVQHDGILHHSYGDIGSKKEMQGRIADLGTTTSSCTTCHHPPPVAARVKDFSEKSAEFQDVMKEIFSRLDDPNHETIDVQAFAMGQELYSQAQELFTKSAKQLTIETKAPVLWL